MIPECSCFLVCPRAMNTLFLDNYLRETTRHDTGWVKATQGNSYSDRKGAYGLGNVHRKACPESNNYYGKDREQQSTMRRSLLWTGKEQRKPRHCEGLPTGPQHGVSCFLNAMCFVEYECFLSLSEQCTLIRSVLDVLMSVLESSGNSLALRSTILSILVLSLILDSLLPFSQRLTIKASATVLYWHSISHFDLGENSIIKCC